MYKICLECAFLLVCVCVQELLKYSKGCDGSEDLQMALSSILGILKAVNDSMHLIAITGYEVQGPRRVITVHANKESSLSVL